MSIRKLQPKVFTEEELNAIKEQSPTQEVAKAAPKSLDPVNFPVFEVPVNKKVLVYVPNHVVTDKDGVERLRMDMPLIHAVQDGRRFLYYRCIANLGEGTGYSGNCPLCEGTADPWDLANEIIEQKCSAQGLSKDDTENETVKQIRRDAYSDRVIKDATRYYTFPIVVFETVNDDGKTFVKDETGNYKIKVMWYSISESQYEDKWIKTLEAMEDEPTHPGGHFFLLNYCYTPKRGEPNKRDSARNLAVIHKSLKNSEKIREKLDELTESWTPIKASQTVCNNVFYSEEDLQYVADTVLEPVRNLLELYKSNKAGAEGVAQNGGTEDGFQLEKKQDEPVAVPGLETDLDDTDDSAE